MEGTKGTHMLQVMQAQAHHHLQPSNGNGRDERAKDSAKASYEAVNDDINNFIWSWGMIDPCTSFAAAAAAVLALLCYNYGKRTKFQVIYWLSLLLVKISFCVWLVGLTMQKMTMSMVEALATVVKDNNNSFEIHLKLVPKRGLYLQHIV